MANKLKIEHGRMLHALLQDENFQLLHEEIQLRIGFLRDQRDRWNETPSSTAAMLAAIQHKMNTLESLVEWIHDEIKLGGAEKMKQELEALANTNGQV